MIAYAGATWDWHRLHHDQEFARDLGFSDSVVDGQHLAALVSRYVLEFLGPGWRLTRLQLSFANPAYPGDRLEFSGRQTLVEGQASQFDLSVVRVAEEERTVILSQVQVEAVERSSDTNQPARRG